MVLEKERRDACKRLGNTCCAHLIADGQVSAQRCARVSSVTTTSILTFARRLN